MRAPFSSIAKSLTGKASVTLGALVILASTVVPRSTVPNALITVARINTNQDLFEAAGINLHDSNGSQNKRPGVWVPNLSACKEAGEFLADRQSEPSYIGCFGVRKDLLAVYGCHDTPCKEQAGALLSFRNAITDRKNPPPSVQP